MLKIKTKVFILLIYVFLITISSVCASNDITTDDTPHNYAEVNDSIELSIDNSTNTEFNGYEDREFSKNKVIKNVTKNDTQTMAATSFPSTFTMSEIAEAGIRVKAWTDNNGKLPNYVTIAGIKITMPELYYLLTKVVVDKYNTGAIGAPITIKYNILNPSKPSGVSVSGSLTKAQYVKNAQSIVNFINSNNQAPNYVSTALGKIQYQTSIYMYSKVLKTTYNTGTMPATVSISVSSGHSMNKYLPTYTRPSNPGTLPIGTIPSSIYNDAYTTVPNLNNYLAASKNCQVNDAKLKSLATTLIKGKTTQVAQAKAIFNWVRNYIVYPATIYYNTKYGAKGTYNGRVGNCVDQSHLLLALYRGAGYPARYVNGDCKFNSGTRYGHTWTQVLIGNTWVVGDPISSSNSLGAINNWNTPNIYGKYYAITF